MAENDNAKWYVIHTYSGYENKVKDNLDKTLENNQGLQEYIVEIKVPMQETLKLDKRTNKHVTKMEKLFPGYVMVEMIMNDRTWNVVRNTRGVTGFVGIGTKPTPLRQEEVDLIMRRMEAEEPVAQVKVKVGDRVRIVEGSFVDFSGVVDEVYPDKGKARVMVSFFNRETPIEVDLLQIERI
jgi:transcriptional antiterminator NusG